MLANKRPEIIQLEKTTFFVIFLNLSSNYRLGWCQCGIRLILSKRKTHTFGW